MVAQRILYVQYANSAAYPPLLHSSRILADTGWDVRMLGVEMDGSQNLREEPHPLINVQRFPIAPVGWRRRAQYTQFTAWVLREVSRFRPQWVYASDPFSTPVALFIKRLGLARVIYHEHDSPQTNGAVSLSMRFVLAARQVLARSADLCVLPQEQRTAAFVEATGREGPTLTVWNCPSRLEVATTQRPPGPPFVLYYHGSLNEQRLPVTILHALARLPETVRLRVVGYETVGSRGFTERLFTEARACGVAERVEALGALPDREDLWSAACTAHVGLALMPMNADDPNMRWMAGASNKPFDYLSQGLTVLVSDLPSWWEMYVEPGYGLACDPRDPESIAAAIRTLIASPERLQAMGEAGRQRILTEWNYEGQFSPVVSFMDRER